MRYQTFQDRDEGSAMLNGQQFLNLVKSPHWNAVCLMLTLVWTINTCPASFAKSPSDPLVISGYRQLADAQYERAVNTLIQAVRVDPGNPEARRYLAIALVHVGRAEDAVQQLDLLVRLFPTSAVDRSSLGEACFYDGKYAASLAHYQLALKLDPNLTAAREGLADAFLALGEPDKAVQACMQGAQTAPDQLTRQRFIARARQIQGNHEQRPRMDG